MIQIISPIEKQVLQRDNTGKASLVISGTNTVSSSLKVIITEVGKSNNVVETLVNTASNIQGGLYSFSLPVELSGGWFELTVKDSTSNDTKTVRFGIGEVIICTGHSFAEGIGSSFVTEERAIIQSNINGAEVNPTDFTDTPVYKSIKDYAFTDDSYSKTRGIWGQMAENIVNALNVPCLIYHSSWGGTNLQVWALASNGGNATGYAGYNPANDGKGYPYAKLKNIVQKLVPKTGARTVMVLHGNNDVTFSQNQIESAYSDLIENTRKDANLPTLPFMLALSTWHHDQETHITNAALNTIKNVPNCYLGADIDTIGQEGRISTTDWHLNQAGDKQAAKLWADALVKLVNSQTVISKPLTPVVVVGGTNKVVETPNVSNNTITTIAIVLGALLGLRLIFKLFK